MQHSATVVAAGAVAGAGAAAVSSSPAISLTPRDQRASLSTLPICIKYCLEPTLTSRLLVLLQFHDSKIKFPLTYNLIRPSAPELKTIYKAKRPTVSMI